VEHVAFDADTGGHGTGARDIAGSWIRSCDGPRADGAGEAGRNPFRFQPRVAPAPPAPPRQQVVAPPTLTETPRPMPPPGPPPAPPIPLKFTGLIERENGVKWAVLTDGKSVMFGKDGDIIDGRYTIVKIGTESIEMTYVDGRGRQVIRLTGQ
jgi:hypothetical protein